jgi:hypothetical protein
MNGRFFHAAVKREDGDAAAEQRENPTVLHSKVSSGIIGNPAGNFTDAGGAPGFFAALDLTEQSEFL